MSTVPANERAEKLIKLAVSARLFNEDDAARVRDLAREDLAADPACPAGRILMRTGLINHAQLNALLALERYRDERDVAKPLLEREVARKHLTIEAARAALEAQRAEYLATGRTRPIAECVAELTGHAFEPEPKKKDESLMWSAPDPAFEPSDDQLPVLELLADAVPPIERGAIAPSKPKRKVSSSSGARRRAQERGRRDSWIAAAVAVAIAVPVCLYVVSSSGPEIQAEQRDAASGGGEVRTTAMRFFDDWTRNGVAAEARYGGKTVQLSGRIATIRHGFADQVVVELETAHEGQRVVCNMLSAENGDAAALSRGRVIEVRGTCRVRSGGAPTLDECSFGD